jgi:CRP/FNR family transcriptional regulator
MGYKRKIAQPLNCPFQPAQGCSACDCRRRCFFNFLSPGPLKRFRAERQMRRYKAHQFIFQEGDQPQGLYIVCVGDVKMTKSDQRGRGLTLHYLSCGDLMGETSFFGAQPYGAAAEALRESVICFLPRALVDYIVEAEPEFTRRLVRRVSRLTCQSMDRTFSLAFRSAESRLADFLIALKPPAAPATSLPCHGRAEYTRREIAENLGLSPETVIRILSAFQGRGLVRLDGKTIELRDRPGLEAIARER